MSEVNYCSCGEKVVDGYICTRCQHKAMLEIDRARRAEAEDDGVDFDMSYPD